LAVLAVVDVAGGQPAEKPAPLFTPERVMASLNRSLAWYRQARMVMQSVDGAGVFAGADEQTVLRLLGRSLDAARAQAALLDKETAGATGTGGRRAEERAKVQADVRTREKEVGRLEARLRTAPTRERPVLERSLAAARNQVELTRARLDFLGQLQDLDTSLSGPDDDLEQQIEAIQASIPELRSTSAGASAGPMIVPASGTWGMLQRLLQLQRSRGSVEELARTTGELTRGIDEDLKAMRAAVKPMASRLRELAKDPEAGGTSLAESAKEFRGLLERRKLVVAAMLPLREESALAHRFGTDLQGWRGAIDRASRQTLQGLALDLVGVVTSLIIVLLGGLLWRVAVMRYVADPSRRLLLTARSVVVAVAVGLVLIFHFTSEIAALVTVLGVAAAGVAFALQNVILAVAGYFTMVAPDGIRVGDRVSLQGPFGYVHGEVMEIGFVRIKLQELAADALTPTGRLVVFPNSVVFTGSFFKDPPPGRGAPSTVPSPKSS
jgi:hypothetical protein